MMYDVLILGTGPAGSKAALTAAAQGLKTAVVENAFVGGACLNSGCIPTKFLIGSTAAMPLFTEQRKKNTVEGSLEFSLTALQHQKNEYIKLCREKLQEKFHDSGVTLIKGKAFFNGPKSVSIKTADGILDITFKNCIVASGSAPAFFPGLKPDGATILSSSGLLGLTHVPKSMIIVGGGPIGLELGDVFHRLGTSITMVEASPRLAAFEDEEVTQSLRTWHENNGWTIHTGTRVKSLASVDNQSVLQLEDGSTLTAEKSLVAIGRTPSTAGLQCDLPQIALEKRGYICVDAFLKASEHVYAIGDVNGKALLANAAEHQAQYVVNHLCGTTTTPYDSTLLASCVYGHMETMRVGPTARELCAEGHSVEISRSELADNHISQCYGNAEGFIKVVWVEGIMRSITGFGHGVSHLVAFSAMLLEKKLTKSDIQNVIFSYPTLDEALKSAILAKKLLNRLG